VISKTMRGVDQQISDVFSGGIDKDVVRRDLTALSAG